jgi:hypothetical protein
MRIFCLIAVITGTFFLTGCQTTKNTAAGVAGIGKGVADDTVSFYKSLEKADKWWSEHYW